MQLYSPSVCHENALHNDAYFISDTRYIEATFRPERMDVNQWPKSPTSCSAAYLNILCKGLPKEIVRLVKKRRRMLKNRNYALSARFRRAKVLDELKLEVLKLKKRSVYWTKRCKNLY